MTNYEAIKNMSLPEVAAMLYIFTKSFMDAFELPPEQREDIKRNINTFLNTEVKHK